MVRRLTTGFSDLSIARKALVLGLVPTIVALLVFTLSSLAAAYVIAHRNTVRDVNAQATVLAETIEAAVSSGDRHVVEQTVAALQGHPRIDAVCVYDDAGQLAAASQTPDATCAPRQPHAGQVSFPQVLRPVLVGDRPRGAVLVTGHLRNLNAWTRTQGLVAAFALAAGLVSALWLTRRLQASVSGPVIALAETADRIARSGDYSPRADGSAADEIGRLARSFNTMLDVVERSDQERRRAEGALRRSEARWRAVIECATDAIIIADRQGQVEAFNPAAERIFGYSEEEVVGRNISLLMPTPYRDEHDHYLARYRESGMARTIGTGRDVTGLRRDGSTFPIRLAVGEMSVDGEGKFVGILHDLTERVEMESRLRDQAALTKLGEMAAVLAHEVKNPIAGVRGAIQIIGARLAGGSREAAVIAEIISRLDTLGDLMKDLLLFARPREPRIAPVDVSSLLHGVASLVLQDPAYEHLRIDIHGSAPSIHADGELLKIALQNLVINSAHAMEGRGRIDMRLKSDGLTCEIAVADSGPGIPEDVRAKLFTPFVTTKARGTGLGLATAKRLVEAHRGTLSVDCPSRGGTTVTVQLPMHPV